MSEEGGIQISIGLAPEAEERVREERDRRGRNLEGEPDPQIPANLRDDKIVQCLRSLIREYQGDVEIKFYEWYEGWKKQNNYDLGDFIVDLSNYLFGNINPNEQKQNFRQRAFSEDLIKHLKERSMK